MAQDVIFTDKPPSPFLGIHSALRNHTFILTPPDVGERFLRHIGEQLIANGLGVMVVDIAGSFSTQLIKSVPPPRVQDTLLWILNYAKAHVGFNIFAGHPKDQHAAVAQAVVHTAQQLWGKDGVGARSTYLLRNACLALLHAPGTTLLDIPRLFWHEEFREYVMNYSPRSSGQAEFWLDEFPRKKAQFWEEAVAPLQNKIGELRADPIMRNILCQPRSTFDFDHFLAAQRVLIATTMGAARASTDLWTLLMTFVLQALMAAVDRRGDIQNPPDFYLLINRADQLPPELLYSLVETTRLRLNVILTSSRIGNMQDVFSACGNVIISQPTMSDAQLLVDRFATIAFNEPKKFFDYDADLYILREARFNPEWGQVPTAPLPWYGRETAIVRRSFDRYYTKRGRVERLWAHRQKRWGRE